MTHFTEMLSLLLWSGMGPAVSLRSVVSYKHNGRRCVTRVPVHSECLTWRHKRLVTQVSGVGLGAEPGYFVP